MLVSYSSEMGYMGCLVAPLYFKLLKIQTWRLGPLVYKIKLHIFQTQVGYVDDQPLTSEVE